MLNVLIDLTRLIENNIIDFNKLNGFTIYMIDKLNLNNKDLKNEKICRYLIKNLISYIIEMENNINISSNEIQIEIFLNSPIFYKL